MCEACNFQLKNFGNVLGGVLVMAKVVAVAYRKRSCIKMASERKWKMIRAITIDKIYFEKKGFNRLQIFFQGERADIRGTWS